MTKLAGLFRYLGDQRNRLKFKTAIEISDKVKHGKSFSVAADDVRRHTERGKSAAEEIDRLPSRKCCSRTGQLVMDKGLLTKEQLLEALAEQARDNHSGLH